MTIADISEVLKYLLMLCAPCALVISLTQLGVNALLSAITGRGIRLNGKS